MESSPARKIAIDVGLPARDQLRLELEIENEIIVRSSLRGIGCREFLRLMRDWRPKLTGALAGLALPDGEGHAAVLLREALLKAKGEWAFPYADEELCHCRAVPTAKVDAAIIGGCHTVDSVKRATSASTSCGTCRPDIERVLAYRLKGR